jgi:ATP-dependent protease ClpP protease subunit
MHFFPSPVPTLPPYDRHADSRQPTEPDRTERPAETQRPIWSRIELFSEIANTPTRGMVTAESFGRKLRSAPGVGIETLINSKGGDMNNAMSIARLLLNERRPTRAIGLYHVFSGAGIIFLAHGIKMLHPSATMMLHPPEYPSGAAPDAALEVARIELLNYYCSRLPRISRAQLELWMDNETYFNASEAVECGLADGLLDQNVWIVDGPEINLAGKSRPGRPLTKAWPLTMAAVASRRRDAIAIPPRPVAGRFSLFALSAADLRPAPANGPHDNWREGMKAQMRHRLSAKLNELVTP